MLYTNKENIGKEINLNGMNGVISDIVDEKRYLVIMESESLFSASAKDVKGIVQQPELEGFQITKPEQLKVGMTVYRVYKLPKDSFIRKHRVTSKPYPCGNNGTRIDTVWVTDKREYDSGFFLQDAGIIENSYNDHKTFSTLELAEQYMNS